MRCVPLLLLLTIAAWPMPARSEFQSELDTWRQQRAERLTGEESWTSLVGLHWLDGPGPVTLGADPDNDIRIDDLPARLGWLRRQGDGWRLELAEGVRVHAGDEPVSGGVDLVSDQAARAAGLAPTRIVHGPVRFILLARGDREALRVWNTEAPSRLRFAGLSYFPADPQWQVRARWQAHEPPRSVEIVDVTGAVLSMTNPGAVLFERDGRQYRLEALAEPGDAGLFLIFADRTSGRETYGAGRYLSAPRPDDEGRVLLDFNRAYNPPCAFSEFATCPLPPPENRLDLRVESGEKRYRIDG